ncbi:DBC1/CARP1 catalytically inactive NUDIX hydrolase domain,SAP domain [Cinara cedri]|uniref:DBC1/CARP1 catalytically inactive NUDIX hydrolase domain,SAP domain n=1 Tax=Cinara cedri TaxID=506608 RepID=A0A5E4NA26_9HEMI|nr:DBC1/CARP1 catalytically inactive NUDIX hydrolase domain,SAP domain [Cinara cedri]
MKEIKKNIKFIGNDRDNQNTIAQLGSKVDCNGVRGQNNEKYFKRKQCHSPFRQRKVLPLQQNFFLPKFYYEISYGSVVHLKLRYKNLYVPSNFVKMTSKWVDEFPNSRPFTIPDQVHSCPFHVFGKEVDRAIEEKYYTSPTDLDFRYSAKVMLLSLPTLEEFYKACLPEMQSSGPCGRHPAHVIQFLVGLSDQSKPMAIGGAWSPSLDGPNPESDPTVLVKTAIRTCRTIIGLDLSKCNLWNLFFKLEYSRRSIDGVNRTETVVMYVPDVWNCVPTSDEWKTIVTTHKAMADQKLNVFQEPLQTSAYQNVNTDLKKEVDEKPDSNTLLMWMRQDTDLKTELESKSLSSVGSRAVLVDRLISYNKDLVESVGSGKTINKINGDNGVLESAYKAIYNLPDQPSLLVYPHRTMKSSKFDCTILSLSELLNYPRTMSRTKEHSFEVYLFCELFNEMLTRDFGYNIFKSIVLTHAIPSVHTTKEDLSLVTNFIKAQKIESAKEIKTGQILDLQVYLLSYAFFDVHSAGYVLETDLENLFYCIGLELSKDQTKNLMSKILQSNSYKINYVRILKQLHSYSYDGLIIFQDPQSVIMDIFNGKSNHEIYGLRPIHKEQLKGDSSIQISNQKSKQLKIYVDQFKKKISTIKTNLIKIEITENELKGILEKME